MTLYRDAKRFGKLPTEPGAELRWVVPVERCEHNKIDAHWIVRPSPGLEVEGIWCPGVAVGEETP